MPVCFFSRSLAYPIQPYLTRKFFLAFFLLLSLSDAYSQNLVPNPGFEDYALCPGDYSQHATEFRVKNWKSANLGTPDHFHSCSQGEAGVPHNWAGVSDAYEGKGYAGIYVWMNNENNFREYLQCRLLQPLMKDSLYKVEFHFRLSSYSKYSIDRIGLVFSNAPVSAGHDQVIKAATAVSVVQDSALTVKTGYWETWKQEYRAKGGEEYLSIGNFSDNATTHHYFIRFMPAQQSMLANSAYYYIDDVRVVPKFLPEEETIPVPVPEFVAENVEVNKAYVLKNIQFDFDSYRLLYPSFEELDQVVLLLERHPTVKILLTGHTDDVGGDQYNLALSRNRAKTVAAYLVSKGIAVKRVEHVGYGKSRPLIESASAEARRVNRRVEAMFVE